MRIFFSLSLPVSVSGPEARHWPSPSWNASIPMPERLRSLKVDPVQDPYIVEPLKVGSYFWLKIVYIKPPSDLAGINIYGYYPLGDGLALAHQWRLLPPFPNPSDAHYGFTGLNYVYEPRRHSELQYWCRFK